MKTVVTGAIVFTVLLVGATDVYAIAWGGGRDAAAAASIQYDPTTAPNHSVPEPSTLYAVGSAIVLLGGAGWYIRRRK